MNKIILKLLIFCTLFFILLQGCHTPDFELNKKDFKEGANFIVQGDIYSQKILTKGTSTSTPHQYQVIVKKYELLKTLDDTDPVVIYDGGDDHALVNLTSDNPTYLGCGTIKEGTYPYCRATIIAISQQIDVYNSADELILKTYIMAYQGFDNSNGSVEVLPDTEISKGDVLVMENSIFNWFQIDMSKIYSYSTNRSDVTPYQAPVTTGEEVKVIEFTSPVTIEKGKKYYGTLTFNVDDTFVWDDLDDDQKFEPTGDDHAGTKINDFYFKIEMPEITAYAITNQ